MKIIKKEFIEDNRNYYDLSIPGTHNFCLGDGEVVHNTGVGFSVQSHHIEKLPIITRPNAKRNRRYLVGDSIEGWADAIKMLMKSYFQGTSTIQFDYRDVRPKGSRLITAGGKAPGPEPLRLCIEKVRSILEQKETGSQLTSLECHDIICHIADAVLAGGIRRAALISLFSADDDDMLAAKSGLWYELHPHRMRANNSVVLVRSRMDEDSFKNILKRVEISRAGEPGVFLTNDKDIGTNPCITGEALVTVRDHDINGTEGVPYEIPLKMLVEMCDGQQELLPAILSYNEETGKKEWKNLLGGQLTKQDAQVIELEVEENGITQTLKCTPDHQIYTTNRGWVEAKDLAEEDDLVIH